MNALPSIFRDRKERNERLVFGWLRPIRSLSVADIAVLPARLDLNQCRQANVGNAYSKSRAQVCIYKMTQMFVGRVGLLAVFRRQGSGRRGSSEVEVLRAALGRRPPVDILDGVGGADVERIEDHTRLAVNAVAVVDLDRSRSILPDELVDLRGAEIRARSHPVRRNALLRAHLRIHDRDVRGLILPVHRSRAKDIGELVGDRARIETHGIEGRGPETGDGDEARVV